uniref:C2H2-type domain-containing protein n=1 Tax=Strigamia maritima TaxID=126957 RepID=T1J7D9_STRMM
MNVLFLAFHHNMAQDVRTPDFDDLLAAFDIPDVPSISVKEEPANDAIQSSKSNHSCTKTTMVFKGKDEKSSQFPTSKLTLGTGTNTNTSTNPNPNPNPNPSRIRPLTLPTNSSSRPKLLLENMMKTASVSKIRLQLEMPDADMTYQLSTNVLPPYIPEGPPPDKFKMPIPFDGFKCLDCGDQFLLESSLKQHLDRRSVYISLNCETCHTLFKYYNRCNLLNHVRNHRDKNEACDVRKADVAPLPRELMNTIPLNSAKVKGIVNGSGSGTMFSHLATCNVANANLTRFTESETIVQRERETKNSKLRCSECCQFFASPSSLSDHFSRSQNMPLATSQCTKCNMTCPSKCSLSAHQRIHLQSPPFTCPECGSHATDNWSSFQQHLSILCLHYSRSIGYKCSICSLLHLDGESLRQHIIDVHSEVYFKCQACPMAFKAGNTFEAHKKTSHLTMDVECKMIFKCPLCDTVFHSGGQLDEHLDIHIKEQIRATKFVFKCLECAKLMDNKAALGEHVEQVHPQLARTKCCNLCGLLFDSKDTLMTHTKQLHHNHNKSKSKSKNNNNNHREEKEKEKEKEKKNSANSLITFACSSCDTSYYNLKSLLRHERAMHNCDGRPKKYVCWICKEHCFTNRTLLEKHVKLVHANEEICDAGVSGSGPSRPSIKMKIPRPKEDVNALPQKQLKICGGDEGGTYTCFKCDYITKFRSDFMQHIGAHKTDRSSLQCCECGACFVVAPALRKHLAVVHRVKDVDGYMGKEKENADDSCQFQSDSALHINGANGLECSVCFNSFSTELSLKTHLRTHGMAFIKSKTNENSSNC